MLFVASLSILVAALTALVIIKFPNPIGGDSDIHCECHATRLPAYEVGHYGRRCGDCNGLIP